MSLRERLWPGLRGRGIALEAVLALLSTVGIGFGLQTPEGRGAPAWIGYGGGVVLGLALLFFRRRAPLLPFGLTAALGLVSPALSIAVPLTSYAVGRYVGRWPVLAGAAVVGSVALVEPWNLDTLDDWIGAIAGVALAVILAGALGAWARTRAALVTALTERAERAESERELLAREAVLTERTRIAREMHDVVGHRVSLMVLQSTETAWSNCPGRCRPPGGRHWRNCARWSACSGRRNSTTMRRWARNPGWPTSPGWSPSPARQA
jgi:signal transduction histidine kinase